MKGFVCAVIGSVLLHATLNYAYPSLNGNKWDLTRTVTVTGSICGIEWSNSHSYAFMFVKRDSGQTEMWSIELPPSNLVAKAANVGNVGVLLKVGDRATVEAYPSKTFSKPSAIPDLTFGSRCNVPGANALLRGAAKEVTLPSGNHLTDLDALSH